MDVQQGFRLPIAPESPPCQECNYARLPDVNVVLTDVPGTLSALRKAGELAANLRARIRLIVPQVVPYSLPLSRPSVPKGILERRFHTLAQGLHIDTHVQICLCRDREQLLAEALPPRSLIVIGGRKRWWRTAEQALASRLRRRGHEVIFAGLEKAKRA
jgi:hypothetical protein